MKYNEICDFRDLVQYSHGLEKRLEKQQKEITKLKKQLQTQKGFLYFAHQQIMKSNYISKDKIRNVIKKYYNDYEEQKRYRYTRDVEEEQSVLKDIEKELLGNGD